MTFRLPFGQAALILIALGTASAAQTGPAAQLAAETFCNSYARNAVIQYRQARYWQCDRGGNRWSDNWGDHMKWCNAVPRALAERELRIREEELEGCKKSMGPGTISASTCRNYATNAVGVVGEAKRLGCNFGGARWSPSYDGHYGWCLRANTTSVGFERKQREMAVERCRSARR